MTLNAKLNRGHPLLVMANITLLVAIWAAACISVLGQLIYLASNQMLGMECGFKWAVTQV